MANPRNLAKIAPIVSAASGKLLLTDTATLNGGTANSLVYLNANKEATTVSTLFFDGTRVGINTTTPGSILDVKGVLRLTGATTGFVGLQAATSGTGVTYTLPASDGLNGQVLQTNGVGSLSWANQTGGGGGGSSGSGTSTSRTAFTATGGQTTFSVEYVVGQVDVYLNGSKLIANNDFFATTGNTVVLAVGATAGSIVEAVVYSSQWITSSTNLYYTGGNIGVGTSSPAALVHAASANTAFAVGTIRIDGADSAGTVNAPVTINAATGGATGNGGSQLYFSTRADGGSLTERLRIDHRGNVGLGVVPSAWTWNSPASGSVVDIGSVGSIFSLAGEVGVGTEVTRNVYYSGTSWIHKTEGAASRFEQSGGAFRWFSAPLALTGNTAVFTEYMRLTADGRLGIGRTNPARPLDVAGAYVSDGAANTIVRLQSTNEYNSFPSSGISFSNKYDSSGNTAGMGAITVIKENATDGDFAGALGLYTRPSGGAVTERVRIDSNGDLGLGVTPSAWQSGTKAIEWETGAIWTRPSQNYSEFVTNAYFNGSSWIYTKNSSAMRYQQGDGSHVWWTAPSGNTANTFSFGTPKMILTANGALVIGGATTSNTNILLVQGEHVAGRSIAAIRTTSANTGTPVILGFYNSSDERIGYLGSNSNTSFTLGSQENVPITFFTNNSEKARITNGGNLGINITSPSAKLHVENTGYGTSFIASAIAETASQVNIGIGVLTVGRPFIGTNTSSNPLEIGTRAATETIFVTNSTERMRLDASGNLGIGTSSPVGKLSVISPAATAAGAAIRSGSTDSSYLTIGRNAYEAGIGITGSTVLLTGATAGDLNIYTNTSGGNIHFSAGNIGGIQLSLNSSGNLGIGTVSPDAKLDIYQGISYGFSANIYSRIGVNSDSVNNNAVYAWRTGLVGSATGQNYIFQTLARTEGSWVERARITSGGDLLVGTTTGYGSRKFEVRGGATATFLSTFGNTNSNPLGVQIYYDGYDPNGVGNEFLNCNGNGTVRTTIRSNGGIANYSANDVSLSDRREKTNFAPAKSYLNTICSIPVQTFEYIDQSPNDPGLTLGVVAQDVQAVAPELVHESNWGTEEEPKMRLGIYQTDMQYALMKCIQEQQALITELQAEIAAIKAKLPE